MTDARIHWLCVPLPLGSFTSEEAIKIGLAAIARRHPNERTLTISANVLVPLWQADETQPFDLMVCYQDSWRV